MKKIKKYGILMFVLSLLLLTGCGNEGFWTWVFTGDTGKEISKDSEEDWSSIESDAINMEESWEDTDANQEDLWEAADANQQDPWEAADANHQDLWEGGTPAVIDGNSVTYGPLKMELPDGFFLEEETENSVTFNGPGGYLIGISLTKDSYQLISDYEQMKSGFKSLLGSMGARDIVVDQHETLGITDGYAGYEVGVRYTDCNWKRLMQYTHTYCKTTDEGIVPMVMVTWEGNDDVPADIASSVGKAFDTIRLK